MDLFLVPNNPLQTSLLSPNGSVLYKITTSKVHGRSVSRLTRAERVVAEIQWRNWDTTTTVRSPQLPGLGGIGTCASEFLYRHGRGVLSSSSTRYFIAQDGREYRWKIDRHSGCILTPSGSSEQLGYYTCAPTAAGLFAGERKARIRIQPGCGVDYDLVVLTFIIMETKRRERMGDAMARDEDPQGDGAGDS
ncbi:hypothetical protein BDZ89DRAFT_1183815 [Hymenopellis radicata]|nr:hypothetical protein BDZ89DRAFT_1183815 [Hymenopellis radicata]